MARALIGCECFRLIAPLILVSKVNAGTYQISRRSWNEGMWWMPQKPSVVGIQERANAFFGPMPEMQKSALRGISPESSQQREAGEVRKGVYEESGEQEAFLGKPAALAEIASCKEKEKCGAKAVVCPSKTAGDCIQGRKMRLLRIQRMRGGNGFSSLEASRKRRIRHRGVKSSLEMGKMQEGIGQMHFGLRALSQGNSRWI